MEPMEEERFRNIGRTRPVDSVPIEAGYDDEPEEVVSPRVFEIKKNGPATTSEEISFHISDEDEIEYENEIADRHVNTQAQW